MSNFELFRFVDVHSPVIPVQRGYEEAALHFLETGQIWNGGAVALTNPDSISALAELNLFYGTVNNNGLPVDEETWETTIPTNLVALQEAGVVISGSGLPENTTN